MNKNDSLISVSDRRFRSTVERWIGDNGEVFVLISHSKNAGARDYQLCIELKEFDELVMKLKPEDNVIVFRERQVPLRGRVNEEFKRKAMNIIPEGSDYLVVLLSWCIGIRYFSGDSPKELEDDLNGLIDQQVMLGLYPPSWEISQNILCAYVPHADGTVTRGLY